MRTLAIATLIIGTFAALTAAEPAAEPDRPFPPTEVTREKSDGVLGEVAAALAKKSGIPIVVAPRALKTKCVARFNDVPFWDGLQRAADATQTRIVLSDGGRTVDLVPRGQSRESAVASGAFRIVAQQVVGRALLDQGTTFYEVHLLVHWEPRLHIYRIDTAPRITKATDGIGSQIIAEGGGGPILPSDATSEMKVKLTGLTRASDKITALAGTFTVTGAEQLLAFSFDPTGKLPAAGTLPAGVKNPGVSATLKRVQKKGDTWEIAVEVEYPLNQPAFESFQGQWWLRDNRLVLRSAAGKTFVLDDFEIPSPDNARPLTVIYRFKEDANKGLGDPTRKGSVIVYETPAPLAKVTVPFELKDIPLP